MGIFSKPRGTLVPIHSDNANTRDWLVLLEAATIVGRERERLRVALTTQERTLVTKLKLFGKAEHFLVVDGYCRWELSVDSYKGASAGRGTQRIAKTRPDVMLDLLATFEVVIAFNSGASSHGRNECPPGIRGFIGEIKHRLGAA
jgi:hypothetical protein